jgi:Trypsin-co-occurring domain 1
MKRLIEFKLADGSEVLVEVEQPEKKPNSGYKPVAHSSGLMVEVAKQTFEEAFDKIRSTAAVVSSKLKALAADETEVKFGLKLTADAGAIFTTVGSEVNFEVTLKWNKKVEVEQKTDN